MIEYYFNRDYRDGNHDFMSNEFNDDSKNIVVSEVEVYGLHVFITTDHYYKEIQLYRINNKWYVIDLGFEFTD